MWTSVLRYDIAHPLQRHEPYVWYTAVSTAHDILTAGGQTQLLCCSLAATAPSSGGPWPMQQSLRNPGHLQRISGRVGGYVGRGGASYWVWRYSWVWCAAEECEGQPASAVCEWPLWLAWALSWCPQETNQWSILITNKPTKHPPHGCLCCTPHFLFSGTLVCLFLHHKGALITFALLHNWLCQLWLNTPIRCIKIS